MIESNTIEMACFEVNEHGRLLSGNKRFCRLFGFSDAEVQWHYITDLCRHAKDWEGFKKAADQAVFEVRMKNRKGRSFCCKVVRQTVLMPTGEIVYRNMLCRKGEALSAMATATSSLSLVFLGRCGRCGAQIRVGTAAETRLRMLCDTCAAQAYPEAYHVKEGQM